MDGAFSFSVEHQNPIFHDGYRTRELLAAGAGYQCEIGERINIEVDCPQPILRAWAQRSSAADGSGTAVAHVHAIDEGYRSDPPFWMILHTWRGNSYPSPCVPGRALPCSAPRV